MLSSAKCHLKGYEGLSWSDAVFVIDSTKPTTVDKSPNKLSALGRFNYRTLYIDIQAFLEYIYIYILKTITFIRRICF